MAVAEVTVLVAVHNAAQYLPKCLDSLLSQTLGDIQVVCIDDCSSDSSLDVLHGYASRDQRVTVLALDSNHGQAYARNEGLKVATGRFVAFLDSDDWFSPDALQQAVNVFETHPLTDCVLFDVVMWHDDGAPSMHYAMQPFNMLSGREAFERSLDWGLHGIYIARQRLYALHPYDDCCRAYSDDNTTRLHYLASREVRCCGGIYYYRQHTSSVSHKVSVRRYDHLRANESMKRSLLRLGLDLNVLRRYENLRWLVLIDTCMFHHLHAHQLSRSERRYGLCELQRVWRGIDRTLLDRRLTRKFGYRPMPSWTLFRLQEWLYFTVRGFLHRNRE